MFERDADLCRGSYEKAEAVSLSTGLASSGKDSGVCPVCGQPMALGYALLLPAHPKPSASS
jgi:hypothetical protein